MTNELLKEAIYAVALRDKLNKYSSGCFAQLYYNYIKNLDPKWDGTYIFYHLCTEAARNKNEKWPRIVGCTYPDLRQIYYTIIEKISEIFDTFPGNKRLSKDEEIALYRNLKITLCVNEKYFCPLYELDYTVDEFSDILRKMPEYSQIDFTKELEQIKLDRIKEDF
jgi:hypothetical protein